jgi:uncharacterized protein (DUF302 family)
MNSTSTRVIPASFDRSLTLVRRLLERAGLSVVEEFDLSKEPYFERGIVRCFCVVLLVDTPVLLFEAIALDRAAAVFLPLHIVISGDRDVSFVHWVNPVTSSGLRPPAPAKEALEGLCHRLETALAALPAQATATAGT